MRCAETRLAPAALTIEITETTLMRNVEETAARLSAIKQFGVRVAIDDFGTGYSSLAHLRQFPVDALKIDRSFITGLANNHEGETLIRTLVQLGKALSIETIAEGIEQPRRAVAAVRGALRRRPGVSVRAAAGCADRRGVPARLCQRRRTAPGAAGDRRIALPRRRARTSRAMFISPQFACLDNRSWHRVACPPTFIPLRWMGVAG